MESNRTSLHPNFDLPQHTHPTELHFIPRKRKESYLLNSTRLELYKMDSEEDDMAAIMGFSSFSDMPKPKRQRLSKEEESATKANNTPLGQRKSRETQIESMIEDVALSERHAGAAASAAVSLPVGRRAENRDNPKHQAVTYTQQFDPLAILSKSVDDLTPQDLQRLRSGVKQVDGRTVFFSPSFIMQDPWNRRRNQR